MLNIEELEKAEERMMNPPKEYDSFEPLQQLKLFPFSFEAARYELWQDGELVKCGRCSNVSISSKISRPLFSGNENLKVAFNDNRFASFIQPSFHFDVLTTLDSRLLFRNIPTSAAYDSDGLAGLRAFSSTTGSQKKLDKLQPFACSLYLKDGVLSKVTFSVNEPESLLELYSE